MKAVIAGIILVILSGGVLLWQRSREPLPGGGPVTGHRAEGPVRTTKCMVWQARSATATVWICGSFHLLKKEDYPLPAPYLKAFAEAGTVVMELPPGSAQSPEMQAARQKVTALPAGKTLTDFLSAGTRSALREWTARNDADPSRFESVKPWTAAVMITVMSSERQGYHLSRGMERYFSEQLGSKKGVGLETAEQQWALFDHLEPAVQEAMIRQAINESDAGAAGLRQRASAWREGDTDRLAALTGDSMQDFPGLRKLLLDDRNAAWVPSIKAFLAGHETVMILVGSGHLTGPGSVIDLLAKEGIALTQAEYQTTRAAE